MRLHGAENKVVYKNKALLVLCVVSSILFLVLPTAEYRGSQRTSTLTEELCTGGMGGESVLVAGQNRLPADWAGVVF